jgi:uncharacterized secreted protein with C-terminal beta-propeller domain
MKNIIITIALLFSTTMADSVLLVKKGWQLIGSSTPLADMSKFQSENVEQVWHFDAQTQQWLGYSPDSTIQAQMTQNSISKLGSLKNWHGFWIKSKNKWALTLPNTPLSSAPSDENSANDTVELKEGWNLISLPVDTVLSANIFEEMTVWKYNPNQEWELFDTEQSTEDFPRLGHIKNSDGIWVKAPRDINISIMNEASKLHNFATTEEMEEYIKEMALLSHRTYCGIEPLYLERSMPLPVAVAIDGGSTEENTVALDDSLSETEDATGTNLQESGVDEADIVKHNGVNIFYKGKQEAQNSHINITTFAELVKGNSNPVETIGFGDNRNISSMYLLNNHLVVLSSTTGNYKDEIAPTRSDADVATPYPDYDIQQILVDIFDVSNINDIKSISSYKIDGYESTSRVIGNNLYLVSSFSPRINISYPKEYIELSSICQEYFDDNNNRYDTGEYDYNRYASCYDIRKDYDNNQYYQEDYENPIVTIQDLLPEIEHEGNRQALINPEKLYVSAKKDQSTSMTTISHITISDGAYRRSNSFMGYSSTQYASTNALYLVSNSYPIYYDFNNYKERSSIYKFALDGQLSYRGIGSVYGHTINQFALSEYQDILRIATTESFSWSSIGINNSIYTLKEQNGLLPIQGILSGLGEEGETIKSVRFMGDKAYLVTFRQTDPLYTIDMSNPEAPKKMGELHIDGYSSYLHPVGEDKLLGIGRDADADGRTKGIKIELFDISDFAHPSSLSSIVLDDNTYSEIEYNHKALAYRNSDNLFAFPYRQYPNHEENEVYFDEESNTATATNTSTQTTDVLIPPREQNYLGIYQVENNALIKYTPISNPNSSGWGNHRGLIFDSNGETYISLFGEGSIVTEKFNKTVE